LTFAIFALIMELTNALRKLISSLNERKHRRSHGLFKAEGAKCIADTIGSFQLFGLFATPEWAESHHDIIEKADGHVCYVSSRDLTRMSSLTTPQNAIAVYEIPNYTLNLASLEGRLSLALDGIQDPGNLGTIMRTADWFGISDILCSHSTADVWNPKVVQATMGAISRVRMHYCDLSEIMREVRIPIYGTFLDGENIYGANLTAEGIIVMGNEGNGISDEVSKYIGNRLTIPSFSNGNETSESLNVAIATAITVSEFRRHLI
jgi:TrmH family RNA methyltransferase